MFSSLHDDFVVNRLYLVNRFICGLSDTLDKNSTFPFRSHIWVQVHHTFIFASMKTKRRSIDVFPNKRTIFVITIINQIFGIKGKGPSSLITLHFFLIHESEFDGLLQNWDLCR